MPEYLKINGASYALNLDKIFEYIFKYEDETNREQEIVENYGSSEDGSLKMSTKTNREIRSNGDSQKSTITYDFIKLLINTVLLPEEDGINDSFPVMLATNTLLKYGLLYKI